MFENKKVFGEYYSRFIASWIIGGGYEKYGFEEPFEEWLKSFEFYDGPLVTKKVDGKWVTESEIGEEPKKMDDKTVYEIRELATCGKMEFESWCKRWIAENCDRLSKEYGYK